MSSSDRLMWFRILTAAQQASSFTTNHHATLLCLLSPILHGKEKDHSSDSFLQNIVDWLRSLVFDAFKETRSKLLDVPAIFKARPSPKGVENDVRFFVE